MGEECRQRCICAWKKKISQLTDDVIQKAYHSQSNMIAVRTEFAATGRKVQILSRQGQIWYLNSSYDPQAAADIWASQYAAEQMYEQDLILVFGLADGLAVEELLRVTHRCKIYIVEPCREVFFEAITRTEVLEVLENERVLLFVDGINDELLESAFSAQIDYMNYKNMILASLPNYNNIFADRYQQILAMIKNRITFIFCEKYTCQERMKDILLNKYALLKDVIQQYSVIQLKGIVEQLHWEYVPAVLAAAGPSLDVCKEDLKKIQQQAFIIAVDTALNTLLEAGIIPDLTVTVDPVKELELFKNPQTVQLPLVLAEQSRAEVVKRNHAVHFYEMDKEGYISRISGRVTGKEGEELPTGGSVANTALSLLVSMGFRTIVLAGQDLAFWGNRKHAAAAFLEKDDSVKTDAEGYFMVPDNRGGMVLTRTDMDLYRRWIESYTSVYKDIRFVNTALNGARIEGAEVCSLEEFAANYELCKVEKNALFQTLQPFYTLKEQQQLAAKILQLPKELEELQLLVQKALEYYERLKAESESVSIDIENVKYCMTRLSELNVQIEENDSSCLLKPYIRDADYRMSDINYQYDVKAEVHQQLANLAEQGLTLFEGYNEGIQALKEDAPLIINQFYEG